jgi:hypothetical protein
VSSTGSGSAAAGQVWLPGARAPPRSRSRPRPSQDGLCEINTFFLIARRQWKSLRRPLSAIYWATFFPLRIALYPLMLVQFWQQMRRGGHAWWEVGAVCGSQAALIAFNVMLLALSAGNWRKRRGGRGRRGPAAPAAPGSPAGGKAAKDFSPTATINAEAATRM